MGNISILVSLDEKIKMKREVKSRVLHLVTVIIRLFDFQVCVFKHYTTLHKMPGSNFIFTSAFKSDSLIF